MIEERKNLKETERQTKMSARLLIIEIVKLNKERKRVRIKMESTYVEYTTPL